MDEICMISLLLDFYGQLVTKRQYEILDMHYNNDCSFGEIAAELNISRQGVYDNIKRGKAALLSIERKLGLVARFVDQKKRALEIMKALESIDDTALSAKDRESLDWARRTAKCMAEDTEV